MVPEVTQEVQLYLDLDHQISKKIKVSQKFDMIIDLLLMSYFILVLLM